MVMTQKEKVLQSRRNQVSRGPYVHRGRQETLAWDPVHRRAPLTIRWAFMYGHKHFIQDMNKAHKHPDRNINDLEPRKLDVTEEQLSTKFLDLEIKPRAQS